TAARQGGDGTQRDRDLRAIGTLPHGIQAAPPKGRSHIDKAVRATSPTKSRGARAVEVLRAAHASATHLHLPPACDSSGRVKPARKNPALPSPPREPTASGRSSSVAPSRLGSP